MIELNTTSGKTVLVDAKEVKSVTWVAEGAGYSNTHRSSVRTHANVLYLCTDNALIVLARVHQELTA